MKIEIKHRLSCRVVFSGEFDGVRPAVEAAVVADANLAYADLTGANLGGANLLGANLAYANLACACLGGANLLGANLAYANLACACLAGANLTDAILGGANLADADLAGAKGLPEDADLLRRVCVAALGGDALDMEEWHTCETTHCLAGWAVHLSGHAGYALEARVGPETAGALLIPRASHMFHASDVGEVTAWCRKTLAELDADKS